MNRLDYRNLSRQLPGGLCLPDCLVTILAAAQNIFIYDKGNPLKGMDFYMTKNVLTSEGGMQLNFPINT